VKKAQKGHETALHQSILYIQFQLHHETSPASSPFFDKPFLTINLIQQIPSTIKILKHVIPRLQKIGHPTETSFYIIYLKVVEATQFNKVCSSNWIHFNPNLNREKNKNVFETTSSNLVSGKNLPAPPAPPKINIEPENYSLEDDVPLPGGPVFSDSRR